MKTEPADRNRDTILVHNPADGTVVGTISNGSSLDVDIAVSAASDAFIRWGSSDPLERGKIFFSAAARVRGDQRNLAALLTSEQGKPLRESRNEIAGFARILEYYASISGMTRGDYAKSSQYGHMMVSREPLGVCAAIIPWNVPAILMGWKIGPVLAAGNTMVLKPSQTAPLTCIALASHLYEAGLPRDALRIVTGTGEVIGEALAEHPGIRSISFTGAVKTGRRVALLAAPALKKTVLELGGSDAMIVCNDADLDAAAKGAVSGRFFNCGQICTAIKRVFVHEDISASFIRRTEELVRFLKIGNGMEKDVQMGPVHTASQRDQIRSLVEDTVTSGMGTLVTGGTIPEDPSLKNGNFFTPALLTGVDPDAPVMKEEVFGPVLPVCTFGSLDEAIQMANGTRYGLGSSIWTHDSRTISRAVGELQAGIIWVNQHLRIPPEVPFGGVKASGIGRENGRYALEQYLEEKTILISP